ncbi:esterase-like activity of phytase family protein [Aeromicrobium sp. Leaf350]|uniref:esterase-like activity of phytase family protein n=1 Tax=Aeromicrobium sp. Leaf350 TaxID=2876565 RepID=UPI001E38A4A0|nr:esterase-like activity of phytase family protein [Aeromicrobium sp. Leaf350]
MNPRHRRLLIPGLLIALLVVVVVATVTGRADAATGGSVACTLTDDRIDEQSGLAVSATHPDTAYLVNDSGSDAEVYAVDLATCEVVGVTEIEDVPWRDPEALALDGDGTLWIADTGDNDAVRDDARLYSLPEPGREDDSVRPDVHPVAFETGREDVEALLVDPTSSAKWVVTKGWTGGELLAMPDALPTDEVSTATSTGVTMPILVTDASMTPDGHYAVVRTYLGATLHDVRDDFAEVGTIQLPAQSQGETIAVEPSGTTVLVGSEGVGEPLHRLTFETPEPVEPAEVAEPSRPASESSAAEGVPTVVWVASVTILGLFAGALLLRRRRRP